MAANSNRMAERIDDLAMAHRRLLTDVSHTLRSPLARLNVALGLARQRTAPEGSQHLDRIEREADRLNTLIGQLLTLTSVLPLRTSFATPFATLSKEPTYRSPLSYRASRVTGRRSFRYATTGSVYLKRSLRVSFSRFIVQPQASAVILAGPV